MEAVKSYKSLWDVTDMNVVVLVLEPNSVWTATLVWRVTRSQKLKKFVKIEQIKLNFNCN